MEKRSRRRIRDLVARPASLGLSENEIGCARISMMARNTNVPFKGRIQKRKTYHLQIITFRLQRAAGPYRSAKSRLMHLQQKHGRSRWNIFKQRAEPRCENSILHKKSVEKKTVSIAGFLIYPSLWAIIVYGAVVHIRSVRPQATFS